MEESKYGAAAGGPGAQVCDGLGEEVERDGEVDRPDEREAGERRRDGAAEPPAEEADGQEDGRPRHLEADGEPAAGACEGEGGAHAVVDQGVEHVDEAAALPERPDRRRAGERLREVRLERRAAVHVDALQLRVGGAEELHAPGVAGEHHREHGGDGRDGAEHHGEGREGPGDGAREAEARHREDKVDHVCAQRPGTAQGGEWRACGQVCARQRRGAAAGSPASHRRRR